MPMFLNSQTRIKTESRRPNRRVETERVAKRFSLSPGMPRYAGWETGIPWRVQRSAVMLLLQVTGRYGFNELPQSNRGSSR